MNHENYEDIGELRVELERQNEQSDNEVARLQQENVMLRELLIQSSLTKLAISLDSASKIPHEIPPEPFDKMLQKVTDPAAHLCIGYLRDRIEAIKKNQK